MTEDAGETPAIRWWAAPILQAKKRKSMLEVDVFDPPILRRGLDTMVGNAHPTVGG